VGAAGEREKKMKIRPSERTIDLDFREDWCERCTAEHCRCEVFAESERFYNIDNCGHPEQWDMSIEGWELKCTAFREQD